MCLCLLSENTDEVKRGSSLKGKMGDPPYVYLTSCNK